MAEEMTNTVETAEVQDIGNLVQEYDYSDIKYFSQLDKDTASNHDVMERIKDCKTVSDLVKAFADKSGKLDKALIMPNKDSTPEEIKSFFHTLGVPENPEEYSLTDGDYKPEEIAQLKDMFRKEILYRNGITKAQGEKVWNGVLSMLQAERNVNLKNFEEVKSSFADRQSKFLEKDFPVEADRKAAMNEDLTLAAEFFSETGLGQSFKDTGLVYNPEVLHKIAQYHKATRASGVMGQGGQQAEEAGTFIMGEQFTKAYGGR